MAARLIIIFIVAFLVYVALRAVLAKKNLTVKQFFALYIASLVGVLLLYLGFTGRLHPVAAIIGAALPFLTRVRIVAFLEPPAPPSPSSLSSVWGFSP